MNLHPFYYVTMVGKKKTVMLWSQDHKLIVTADGETKKISKIGIINTERLIGKKMGSKIKLGNKNYYILEPALKDAPDYLDRKAQVVLPRIGVQIGLYCDIFSGKKVVEGGAGSGMLSAVLAKMIGTDGKLTTYETRKDFIKVAKSNLKSLDIQADWDIVEGDVTKDVKERDVDAFVVDIPDPWNSLDMADKALKNGGFFAGYIPSTNQLEKTVKKMREYGYIDIKSFESLERDIVVKDNGVRPSYDMLGHTGYVAIARKTP